MTVRRGDIVYVTFPDPDDIPEEEFENPHPAVVIQNDSDNEKLDTTVLVPLTTGSDPHPLNEVLVSPPEDDVDRDSLAKLNHLTTVSIPGRIFDEGNSEDVWKMGEVSTPTMNEIEQKLEYILSL